MASVTPEGVKFQADFTKYVGTLAGRMVEFDRRLVYSLAENVIVGGAVSPGTPKRSGFAQNSWVVAIGDPGAPRQPVRNRTPTTPVSVVSLEEAAAALAGLRADAVVWITSNCVYILALENGASNIQPTGMIALAVAGIQQLADTVAAEMVAE